MKILIHKANNRGVANHGWLQANHSFSFASYNNPEKVHFGALRVLNDDVIAPKMGFGTHPHDNMEIITIPLKGVLKHKDNMGDTWLSVMPGEVQVMSAGTGVQHSEINGSVDDHLSLFQIWVFPNKEDVQPRYDQKAFDESERKNKLQTLVSSMDDQEAGSLKIYQDAVISRIDLDEGAEFKYQLKSENHGVYVMTIDGNVSIENENLEKRDAAGISETAFFTMKAEAASSLLFIEVPMKF
ncbi:pirin family protein [Mariniflexile sp. AS56]|uniref:pirin family protein n=1 Tax=Mariniflexile sp. AS56 TaxID=3063957 RepID=UPI0026E9BF7A|nr:pirin family protein [Mariniflexile sp. AS56]MDO7171300.1 pirin family protein [Mariniflexile sp. AS56]